MKKDWNAIRKILQSLKEAPALNAVLRLEHFEHYAPLVLAYHLNLLAEAGFVETTIQNGRTGDDGINSTIVLRLNSSGHKLFDIVHSDLIWGKILESFQERDLDMTFDLVLSVGKSISDQLRSHWP